MEDKPHGTLLEGLLQLAILIGILSWVWTVIKIKIKGVVFQNPINVVQKAAVDALVVKGFSIMRSDLLYVEGFKPHKKIFSLSSGGETVKFSLKSLGSSKTRVRVNNKEIFAEMKKILESQIPKTGEAGSDAVIKINAVGENIDTLLTDLRDSDWMAREGAVDALSKLKDFRAIEALIAVLSDTDFDIRAKAANALRNITAQDFGQDADRWHEWWTKNK